MPNKIVRWVKPPYGSGCERIEFETDPRHAEMIIHQLGLSSSSRSVSTLREKSKPGVDLSSLLNSADHTLYLPATMRLCCLALDRLDLQFTSKELARWHGGAQSVARYSIGHGRLVRATSRGTVSCCGVQCFRSCRMTENTEKHIFVQTVLWFSHATSHQHHLRSHRLKVGRARVQVSGEGNVSSTRSSLNAQRLGS